MINLKEIRRESGYSQQELADKLGIKQQQYSRYETGENQVSLGMFLKILEICGYIMQIQKNRGAKK